MRDQGKRTSLARIARLAFGVAALAVLPGVALADTYPSRPIKLIVGFAAGSASDYFARIFIEKMSAQLGVPVIVDNRPGGGQVAAIAALKSSAPDGYTLYMATGSSLAQGPSLRKDLPFDPLKDFSMIGYLADVPGAVIVNPRLPVKNVSELIAYARANPGKLNFGSSGVGSAGHLSGEIFMARTGTRMLHIPYKADTEAAREVMAGTLQVAFTTLRTASAMVAAGQVRGVLTLADKQMEVMPGVPGVAEAGVPALRDIVPYTYYTLVGPAKLPDAIVRRLNEMTVKVTAMPDYEKQLTAAGVVPRSSSPAGLRSIVEKDSAKWRELGKTVKIDL